MDHDYQQLLKHTCRISRTCHCCFEQGKVLSDVVDDDSGSLGLRALEAWTINIHSSGNDWNLSFSCWIMIVRYNSRSSMNSSQKVLNFGKVVIVLWLHKMIVKCLCFSCCLTCIVLGISMSSGIWNEKGNAYGFDSSIKNRLPVDNRRYLVIWKRVIRSVSCTWNAISPVNWISILCVSIRWWGWIMTWPKNL